jgi:hypothetical protein
MSRMDRVAVRGEERNSIIFCIQSAFFRYCELQISVTLRVTSETSRINLPILITLQRTRLFSHNVHHRKHLFTAVVFYNVEYMCIKYYSMHKKKWSMLSSLPFPLPSRLPFPFFFPKPKPKPYASTPSLSNPILTLNSLISFESSVK